MRQNWKAADRSGNHLQEIKHLGSRIRERCGTDPGEIITGNQSGEPPASTSKSRGRPIPEELERKHRGRITVI